MLSRLLAAALTLSLGVAACTSDGSDGSTDEPGAELAAGGATETFRLDNGLTVVVHSAGDAIRTGLVVVFGIGGDQDPDGSSGLAHLVEHVYVTAAAGDTPARSIEDVVGAYRDGWNAQTGDDYTVFGTVFPPDQLDDELADAGARMSALDITEAHIERERPRVLDELANMYGGIPELGAANLAREQVRPTPFGGRKGGVPAEVEALDISMVQDRVEEFYGPANATLAVVGALDPDKTRAAIERSFGEIRGGEPAPAPAIPAAVSAGGPVEVVSTEAPSGAVGLAYRAPAIDDPIFPAFLLLAARFLRGSQRASYAVLDDPAAFIVTAELAAAESPEEVVTNLELEVAATLAPALSDADVGFASEAFGPLLGFEGSPSIAAQNPYGAAFSLAQVTRLGLDAETLEQALASVTEADLDRVRAEVFGEQQRGAAAVVPT